MKHPLWLLTFALAIPGSESLAQAVLLPAELAFRVEPRIAGPLVLEFQYRPAPGYRLHPEALTARSSSGSVKIERTEVVRRAPGSASETDILLRVHLSRSGSTRITAEARGCAREPGVCYPPIETALQVDAPTRMMPW
jgi:hypothetical protein